jgi:carboxymethylenebutenolidase
MNEKWIQVETHDSHQFDAYLTLPPTGSGPGIVLIQEIFGVNAHIRAVADQYAMDGFVVLAPDMFWRQQVRFDVGYDQDGFATGFAHAQKMDGKLAVQDIRSTVAALRAMPQVSGRIAAVGYCMGGRLAYAAAAYAGVDAAVAYYGGGIQGQLQDAPKIQVPILFHYGALDKHIPPEAVSQVRGAFAHHSKAPVFVYDHADHGFNCWARPMYHQASAALARGRTLEFLAETIC